MQSGDREIIGEVEALNNGEKKRKTRQWLAR